MKQLQMFDPRDVPVATAEMLSDCGLRSGIAAMRSDNDRTEWPFVEFDRRDRRCARVGRGRSRRQIRDFGPHYLPVGGSLVCRA